MTDLSKNQPSPTPATGGLNTSCLDSYDQSFNFSFPPTQLTFPAGPTFTGPPEVSASNQNARNDPRSHHDTNYSAVPSTIPSVQPLYIQPQELYTTPISSATFTQHVHDVRSTNPRPLQQPDPNFSFDFDLLDPTMMDLSSTMNMATPFNQSMSPSTPPTGVTPSTPSQGFGAKLRKMTMRLDHQTFLKDTDGAALADAEGQNADDYSRLQSNDSFDPGNLTFERITDMPTQSQQTVLTGGWFDADDVPPIVRDHL